MSIGTKIKELRDLKKINQKELSEGIGIDRTTVSQWENDNVTPHVKNLQAVAKFFEVDFSVFGAEAEFVEVNKLSDENVLLTAVAILLKEVAILKGERERITPHEALDLLMKKGGPILAGLNKTIAQDL